MQNAEPVVLRQIRDLGQNITATFTFLRQNKVLFKYAAILSLPLFVIGSLLMNYVPLLLQGNAFDPLNSSPFGPAFNTGTSVISYLVGVVITMIGFTLLMASVHEYLRAYHLGEHHYLNAGVLFDRCREQFGHYLGVGLLMPFLVSLSFLMCFIPGLFVGPILCLAISAHAIERTGGMGSWGRSNNLVSGDLWGTMGLFLVIWIIWYVVNFVLQLPFLLVGGGIGFATGIDMLDEPGVGGAQGMMRFLSWFQVLAGLMQSICYVFTLPLVCVSMCLKYFSRVEEREGHGLREKIASFDQL